MRSHVYKKRIHPLTIIPQPIFDNMEPGESIDYTKVPRDMPGRIRQLYDHLASEDWVGQNNGTVVRTRSHELRNGVRSGGRYDIPMDAPWRKV